VCLGWLPDIILMFRDESVGNFTAIRTIRVLKVLKTIQRVEGVRKLVSSLLNSMPLLLNVGNLLLFIFFIFGIFGSQLFMGSFRQQCFFPAANLTTPGNITWVVDDPDSVCSITNPVAVCGENGICDWKNPTTNVPNSNPSGGTMGFDNIFMAFLTILTSMSLEGWVDTMKLAWDSKGFIAVPYFLLIVVLGALFAINLVSAVIYEAYMNNVADVDGESHENSIPDELIEYDTEMLALKLEEKNAKIVHYDHPMKWNKKNDVPVDKDKVSLPYYVYHQLREQSYKLVENDTFGSFITLSIVLNTGERATSTSSTSTSTSTSTPTPTSTSTPTPTSTSTPTPTSTNKLILFHQFAFVFCSLVSLGAAFMSLEYHGATDSWNAMLSDANMFFTIEFTIEMVIKFIGYGALNYFSDHYNMFDFVIVTFS